MTSRRKYPAKRKYLIVFMLVALGVVIIFSFQHTHSPPQPDWASAHQIGFAMADEGNVFEQVSMGTCYWRGACGYDKNNEEAYFWLTLAGSKSCPKIEADFRGKKWNTCEEDVAEQLADATYNLSRAQIGKLNTRVKEWNEKHKQFMRSLESKAFAGDVEAQNKLVDIYE
ncbi:MAG: hypothetical protein EPN97_13790, partial [Alphaproteobacteria bacterium]